MNENDKRFFEQAIRLIWSSNYNMPIDVLVGELKAMNEVFDYNGIDPDGAGTAKYRRGWLLRVDQAWNLDTIRQ